MTKVLVTGANGQLGQCIQQRVQNFPQFNFLFTDVDELNITDADAVGDFFLKENPTIVINCAAYTAVDNAEQDEQFAGLLNRDAVRILSHACRDNGSFFIHVSTDYVFSGEGFRPYAEEDEVAPKSVYGRTKMEGEGELLLSGVKGIVLRTSWLYSEFGSNFVKSMIRLGNERDELGVVADQVGSPTYAGDLAEAILAISDQINNDPLNIEWGIYHYANEGVSSWYDFTLAIHEISGIQCVVKPIETDDYPTPAKRPHYSVLNKSKIKRIFGLSIAHWRESLKLCIRNLK